MQELDEAIAAQPESVGAAAVFNEIDELDLASELLEITDEGELDQFLGGLIRRAGKSIGQFVRSDTGRALGGILKGVAKKAVPMLGGAIGAVAGPAGGRAGAQLASAAGRIFGLELEGLSPEDQELETARRFVRFGGSAVRHAARASRTASPRAAARAGARRAAQRHAPGLLRRGGGLTPIPVAGRWFHQGRNVIVINCAQPGQAASPAEPGVSPAPTPEPPDSSAPDEGLAAKEATVHDIDRTLTELDSEVDELEIEEFEFDPELEGELGGDFESPFDEAEELAYATELLSIASEEELDMFLGKLLKGAWRGIKKVGKVVGKVARPLGGILKGIAKKALPFVGGALGSLIPIPGVGTAVGSALGGALSKALEAELEGMAPEERELEMARRFVRVAGSAAQQVASMPPTGDPVEAAKQAVAAAAQRHVPGVNGTGAGNGAGATSSVRSGIRGRSGRWIRRGSKIVVMGV